LGSAKKTPQRGLIQKKRSRTRTGKGDNTQDHADVAGLSESRLSLKTYLAGGESAKIATMEKVEMNL
jgi:hypothetical protein